MNYEKFLKVENLKKKIDEETSLFDLKFYHVGGGFYVAEGVFEFNNETLHLIVSSEYVLILEKDLEYGVLNWDEPLVHIDIENDLVSPLDQLDTYIGERDLYYLNEYYLLMVGN